MLVERVDILRKAVAGVRGRHPFMIDAWVVLPEHLHAVWTLPDADGDFAVRWSLIKTAFSRAVAADEYIGPSRRRRGERGIWQRRYWEHRIRDEADFAGHVAYVHYNPVRHGHAPCASGWPYSTIHRDIRAGLVASDWAREPELVEQE